jgi:hypothetical protein
MTLRIGADDTQHVDFENGAYLINPYVALGSRRRDCVWDVGL